MRPTGDEAAELASPKAISWDGGDDSDVPGYVAIAIVILIVLWLLN